MEEKKGMSDYIKYKDPAISPEERAEDLLSRMTLREKIAQLEKLICVYYEFKRFCYGQGECYIKYFSDQWEHCHNSRCNDFEYITPYIEQLEKLKKKNS
jgi:hypothetical protein